MEKLSAKKSIEKITVKDIVNDCGLTKTTFYNHFRDKYDLIVWIYATPIKNIVRKIDVKNYTLHDGIVDVLNYCADNRNFLINAIKNTSGQNYFLNQVAQIHFNLMKDLIKTKISSQNLPLNIEVLSKLYSFGSVQILCEWLINEMNIPIKDLTKFIESGIPEELKKFFY